MGTVLLRSQDARYERAARGWGQYDIMSKLAGNMVDNEQGASLKDFTGMIHTYWYETSTLAYIGPGLQMMADPVGAMVPTPLIDNSQRMDLTAFDPVGDWPEYWCDYVQDFDGNTVHAMFSTDPPVLNGTQGFTGLRSRFALPRNPMFAIRLWRCMPGENITAEVRHGMRTIIEFGAVLDTGSVTGEAQAATVRIILPYETPPEFWWKHPTLTGNQWDRMLGETRGLSWGSESGTGKGMPNAQFITLHIGCFRSGIVVSGDGFRDDIAYMQFPIQDGTGGELDGTYVEGPIPDVSAGKITAMHNAGMWFYSFLPLIVSRFVVGGDPPAEIITPHGLWGPMHDAGYPVADRSSTPEDRIISIRGRHKPQPLNMQNPAFMDPNQATYNQEAKMLLWEVSGETEQPLPIRALPNDPDPLVANRREWYAEFQPTRWAYQYTRTYGAVPMQKLQTVPGGEGPIGIFKTELAPELYAVNMAEMPRITGGSAQTTADIAADVPSFSYSAPDASRGAHCQFVLDNQQAQHRELREQPAREVQVRLGYYLDDDSQEWETVLTGILTDSVATEDPLSVATVAPQVPDFNAILTLAVSDGMLPCFDGWPTWRALLFLLKRAGFHRSEMGIRLDTGVYSVDMADVTEGIEDNGSYLSVGIPEEPIWLPQRNVSIEAFLTKIVNHSYDATFWWSPTGVFTTGCRYCRRRRDGSVDETDPTHPLRHVEDAGPNSSGCVAYDVVRAGNAQGIDHELYTVGSELVAGGVEYISQEVRSIRVWNARAGRDKFANRVHVTAPERNSANTLVNRRRGDPADTVSATREDYASIHTPTAINYAHGEVYAYIPAEDLMTQGAVNKRAQMELAKRSSTTEFIEVSLPLNPQIRKGQTFRINGGDIGVNVRNHVYRVEYVDHDLTRGSVDGSQTNIGGIYLRTQVPA
jgi:hypothetical protein